MGEEARVVSREAGIVCDVGPGDIGRARGAPAVGTLPGDASLPGNRHDEEEKPAHLSGEVERACDRAGDRCSTR